MQPSQKNINIAVASRTSKGLALLSNSLSLLRNNNISSSSTSTSTLSPLAQSAANLDVCSFRTTFLPPSSTNTIKWDEGHLLSFSIDTHTPSSAANLSKRTLFNSGGINTSTTTNTVLKFIFYLDAEIPESFPTEMERFEVWKQEYIKCVYSIGLFDNIEDLQKNSYIPTMLVLGRSEFAIEGGTKAVIIHDTGTIHKKDDSNSNINGIGMNETNNTKMWPYIFWYLKSRAYLGKMSFATLPQDWSQPDSQKHAFFIAKFIAKGQPDLIDDSQLIQPMSFDCYFITRNALQGMNSILATEHKERILSNKIYQCFVIDNILSTLTSDIALIEHGCMLSFFSLSIPEALEYDKEERYKRVKWKKVSSSTTTITLTTTTTTTFSEWASNILSSSNTTSTNSLVSNTVSTKPRSSSASSLLPPKARLLLPSTPLTAKTPAPNAVTAPTISTPLTTPSRTSVLVSTRKTTEQEITTKTEEGKEGVLPLPPSTLSQSHSTLDSERNKIPSTPVLTTVSTRRHSTSSTSKAAVDSTPSKLSTLSLQQQSQQTTSSNNLPISSSQKPPLKKDASKFFKEMLKKS
jgi:hypothetical protein